MIAAPRAVLVTGATGFVGRQALAALLARGLAVNAVTSRDVAPPWPGVVWHRANLLDATDLQRLFETVAASHLLHLAWNVEHGKFWNAPDNEQWAAASLDLLRRFAGTGGERAVMAGTCAEYDWNRKEAHCFREDDPCRPATPYGRAKLALAEAAQAFSGTAGLSLAWARFFFMFGPGEDQRRLIPLIARGLLQNRRIALSAGHQTRDFLDTRDVGEALVQLVLAKHVAGPVNIASGRAISIRELATLLAHLANRDEELLDFGALAGAEREPPSIVADISRLRHEAGFVPMRTLEERLAECLEWHRAVLCRREQPS